jgi:hypothetical protein
MFKNSKRGGMGLVMLISSLIMSVYVAGFAGFGVAGDLVGRPVLPPPPMSGSNS